jgi:hypothetical protein
MSEDQRTKPWTAADIDRLLKLLAVIEEPDFVAFTWPRPQERIEDGTPVLEWPYPDYHPVVNELWEVLYKTSAYIDPYGVLPEDPSGLEDGTDTLKVLNNSPRAIPTATLDQIRRYLVLCTRGERFSTGYIAEQFENGSILAAYRRLKELRAAMP